MYQFNKKANFIIGIILNVFILVYYLCNIFYDSHHITVYVVGAFLIISSFVLIICKKAQSGISSLLYFILSFIFEIDSLYYCFINGLMVEFNAGILVSIFVFILPILMIAVYFKKPNKLFCVIISLLISAIIITRGISLFFVFDLSNLFSVVLLLLVLFQIILSFKFEKKTNNIISELTEENQDIIIKNESIDDLYKYKSLLDNGAITQEEFDAKKKELLNM